MTTPEELQDKLWKTLADDRTVMLGVPGSEEGAPRPMTALVEDGRGPVWFFAGRPNSLVELADGRHLAQAVVASKGHDLFATVHGTLSLHNDPAVIDRLWNPFIAAWFDGKDDPKLALLRFDPHNAEVWKNENNLLAGIKMLIGVDPKKDYADNQAHIPLR